MKIRYTVTATCEADIPDHEIELPPGNLDMSEPLSAEEAVVLARRELAASSTPMEFLRAWNLIDNPSRFDLLDVVSIDLVGEVEIGPPDPQHPRAGR